MIRNATLALALALAALPHAGWAQDGNNAEEVPASATQVAASGTGDASADSAAQDDLLSQRAGEVVAVLGGQTTAPEIFSEGFLAQVSADKLAALAKQMEGQFGPLKGVDSVTPTGPNSALIAVRFDRAIARGKLQLSPDDPHLVSGLLFNQFETLDDSADRIVADLKALPGHVSVLYAPLDRWQDPVISLDPDREMAIGSTFKLYVLSALAHSVARGEHGWDERVRLTHRSLPSGQMQDWPQGTPVTVATLAIMMISVSDNTATDQLIDLLGRDTLADEVRTSGHSAPDKMLPFLSTLDLFALKGDETRGGFYALANEDEQAQMLAELEAQTKGDAANITPPTFAAPHAIDTLEWFASASDLRGVLDRIKSLDEPIARKIMAVNPSVPAPMREKWAYVGFKGGSEPGVLNLTWLLQSKSGDWHVLVMSWNNPDAPVDKKKFELLALRILGL